MLRTTLYYVGILIILLNLSTLHAQNISTVAEIYNYDEGDIFHSRFYEEIDGYWWESISSRTITNKYYSQDNDTVFYTTDVIKMERETYPPGWEWSQYTVNSHYTNLDSLINNGNIDTVFTDEELYNGRVINYLEVENYPNTYNEYRYVDGCGRAYYYYNSYGAGYSYTELLYYKKGDDEWGTPILVLDQKEMDKQSDIMIYPNPAHNSLNISAGDRQFETVQVFDIKGSQVLSLVDQKGSFSIDVSSLRPGTYIISLKDKANTITEVFVKE